MIRRIAVLFLFTCTFTMGQGCTKGAARAGEGAAPGSRISLERAREAALARVPGAVTEEELEEEDGKTIYSFDIQPSAAGSSRKEVHIDAQTGAVLRVEDESAEDEAKEDEDEKGEKGEKDDDDDDEKHEARAD